MTSKFYTNIFQRGDRIYVRGYKDNLPYEDIIHYRPYLFLPKKGGKYSSLDGKDLDKIEFDSIKDARDFIQRYDDVANMEIFGLTNFMYAFINDEFPGQIQYDPSIVSIGSIDIEVASNDGFPSIEKADKEITAIALVKNNHAYVFGRGDFIPTDDNTSYMKFDSEEELLAKFIQFWNFKSIKLDIVTGWNIEFFDIPYLVNRITKLLGKDEARKLSPWKIVEEKTVEFKGKENQTYTLVGISTLDYYQLYRKFSFSNEESYKLGYIAEVNEVGTKIDYSEYGSLTDLYEQNYQKFIEYNIHDARLVSAMDDKLGFISQVMAFAYDAKVNYCDTMTTVKPWDVIIHNDLLASRIAIPQYHKQHMPEPLVGGYVKEPKIGMHKWVVSFDLDSLYPHLIMMYNISPEMFVKREVGFPSIDNLLNPDIAHLYSNKNYSYAANGCTYRKDKQGFLPRLMEKMYNDRVEYKKKMIEAKKEYEVTKNPELLKDISKYHNFQLAKKIQLNSAYGALANLYFRWFNFDHAEAITTSGQLSIRWIERDINIFMNKTLGTKNIDYVIAADTDSIYVNMEELVKVLGTDDELAIVKAIDIFCEKKIQPVIQKSFDNLGSMMNAYQQKMRMKRETIANKAIWKAAKIYIMNAWNIEGVQFDKPKLKMTGVEAVRSSTPNACRSAIKEAFSIIMNGTESDLKKYVAEFYERFLTLPFEEVAFPRGINGMEKYRDSKLIYSKGTPIQVKGALLFNNLIKKHNLHNIPPIVDGDKVKFAYLKLPNPIQDTVIATGDYVPKEFGLDKYIDRDIQFQKGFLEPLKSITSLIGWDPENRSTLESFFG